METDEVAVKDLHRSDNPDPASDNDNCEVEKSLYLLKPLSKNGPGTNNTQSASPGYMWKENEVPHTIRTDMFRSRKVICLFFSNVSTIKIYDVSFRTFCFSAVSNVKSSHTTSALLLPTYPHLNFSDKPFMLHNSYLKPLLNGIFIV